jgi:hypothetical protein
MTLENWDWLRLPVVSAGAEYLVMGNLMRRNILAFKAPQNNEGYDLICIHPNPRYIKKSNQKAQLRIQVKSRYATDCNKAFIIREKSIEAFDYLIVVFLNIGKYFGENIGDVGKKEVEYYTLPQEFVKKHHLKQGNWEKILLKPLLEEIDKYKNEKGFELIARKLGIIIPIKNRKNRKARLISRLS